jgi:UDP-glucose 4-epimerase
MALKRFVVTGGAGFIGSNLAMELSKKHEVIIIDNLSTGRKDNLGQLEGIEFLYGNILDLSFLADAMADTDGVFHLAALPSVQRSINDPISTNATNVDGTLNVLIAARDCGVGKVVFASSSSVYGDTPTLPKKEDMKSNPKSPYAITKLIGEHYCRVFSEIYGLKASCLRYFNVYGPRQDPNSEYAAVIPRFIKRILAGKPPIIFGDGSQTRDFTFVEDVVAANMLAMESNAEGVFNIAYGHRVSLNDLAEKIMQIAGIKIDLVYGEPRTGDVKDSMADISSAAEMFGYAPKFDLNSGLQKAIKWFQKS